MSFIANGGVTAIDDVLDFANFASLPVTGSTGTLYITTNNNKQYRWSGSAYVELVDNNAVWGSVTGTLSAQTDLQAALNLKVNNSEYKTTLEFMSGVLTNTYYAEYAMTIDTVTNILNAPTTTITVGGSAYTLGSPIPVSQAIVVTVSTASVIRLNCTK